MWGKGEGGMSCFHKGVGVMSELSCCVKALMHVCSMDQFSGTRTYVCA